MFSLDISHHGADAAVVAYRIPGSVVIAAIGKQSNPTQSSYENRNGVVTMPLERDGERITRSPKGVYPSLFLASGYTWCWRWCI